jgi:hypothetical protein
MKLKNSKFLLILLVSFFSFPVPGQDNYANRNGDRQNYNGTQSSNNSYGKRGTKARQNENYSGAGTSAEGTGEYFLVPAIVRNDPQGTAIRMNTCGAAILHLLDKNALGV